VCDQETSCDEETRENNKLYIYIYIYIYIYRERERERAKERERESEREHCSNSKYVLKATITDFEAVT
jgi:hypothetical protein